MSLPMPRLCSCTTFLLPAQKTSEMKAAASARSHLPLITGLHSAVKRPRRIKLVQATGKRNVGVINLGGGKKRNLGHLAFASKTAATAYDWEINSQVHLCLRGW